MSMILPTIPSQRTVSLPMLLWLLTLPSCGTLKSITSSIPLPGLPDITTIKRVLPGSEDRVNDQDPNLPFDPRSALQSGHTLRLKVHEGLRSARSLWNGLALIDADGNASIGKAGTVRLRGKTLPEAANAISGLFNVSGHTSSPVIVHIVSVENVPVILVNGDMAAGSQPLPVFDGLTIKEAVRLSGGRRPGSSARSLYLIREGQRRYFRNIEAADSQWRLQAGDIISLSDEL